MQTSRLAGTPVANPEDNRLLAALLQTERQRWRGRIEHVDLEFGQVLCEPGVKQTHVHFPAGAIVSLVRAVESGSSTEIAVIGNEGCLGAELLFGGGSAISRGEVQVAGEAFRICALAVEDAFARSEPARRLLLRSVQALMTQIAQTAVCNRHHTLDQRLCRHLLLRLDRLPGNEFVTTHELIAHALGVRREGVTESAHRLQAAGIIRCTRCHIAVLDRARLERRCCECYGVVSIESDRLLGVPSRAVPRCANGSRGWAGSTAADTARRSAICTVGVAG